MMVVVRSKRFVVVIPPADDVRVTSTGDTRITTGADTRITS